MNVLILGMSSIVARRVLPAMQSAAGIDAIDVASSRLSEDEAPEGIRQVYSDYQEALEKSDAELVYVSLVNSVHDEWAEASLRSGRHTVVDKPACLNLARTRELVELAGRAGVALAESTVFDSHPQFDRLSSLADELGPLTRIYAAFSFPPLPDTDFRLSSDLGGGAFLDLGPYAVGAARVFFGSSPDTVHCNVLSRHASSGVETAFSVSMVYPGGRSLVGQFGFDTEYQNSLAGFGPGWSFRLDRAFTTTPDLENEIQTRQANQPRNYSVGAEDSFARFLQAFIDAVNSGNAEPFRSRMLDDAQLRERLTAAAGKTT